MRLTRWRGIVALALLAAFLNILPRLFLPPGSDVLVHYSLIECFSRQLWEGHFYPRWCIEGNTGLGGSDFLFYFPVPYYVTALFYPLKPLIGIEGVYLCGLFVASVAAFLTCRWWLSDVAGEEIALAGAFLFLWLPYRSELLYYRSAYPELCEISLLPLLFLWLRRAASGRRAGWPALAFLVALMFFTHVPTTIIALAAGSLYLILLSPQAPVLLKWTTGLALGFLMCAIYAVPAETFLSAMNPLALVAASHEWPSQFLRPVNFLHQTQAAVADTLSLLALILMAVIVIVRRRRIEDVFMQREITAWCVIAAIGVFMLFNVSAPLWWVIKTVISVAATPWRVQMVLMFALIYLFAVYGRWLMSPRAATFATGNYALALGFFVLLALFATTMPIGKQALLEGEKVHLMGIARYSQTRWTDAAHSNVDFLLAESKRVGKEPRIRIFAGQGAAQARQWDDDGIIIEAKLREKSLLGIRQFYFPLWHATVDGKPTPLVPQDKTGLMLLSIPAGNHRIALYTSLTESLPQLYPLAEIISFAAAFITLLGFLANESFDKRITPC